MPAALTFVLAAQLAAPAPGAETPGDYVRYESFGVGLRMEADGSEERQIRTVLLLRTAEAVREFGQVTFPYAEGQDEVAIDELSVQKPDGRTIAPKGLVPEVVNPIGVNSMAVPPDLRIHKVNVPGLEPGDRLSYRVVWRRRPLTPGTAFAQVSIQPLPGDPEQVLELDLPRDQRIRARLRDGLGAKWEEVPAAPDRLLRRLRLRAPRPDYGPKGPTPAQREAELASDVVITSFESLDEVARWWWALSKDRMKPDRKIEAEAGPRGHERETLTRLHAMVAGRVRYLNVGFGVGRMQPRAAAEVLESRFGDCKDKHALLAALAQSLGIDVRPVLIHSRRENATDDTPSPQQFDHVISVARLGDDPAGWLWMDATNNFASAGYLTTQLRDKRALLVEADGRGVLVRTPKDPPFEPRLTVDLDGALEASGTLRAHVRWTFRSDLEVLLRAGFTMAPRERHEEMVRTGLAREWKDGKVSNVSYSDPAQVTDPFRVEFDVERTVTGRRSDREWPLWIPLPEFNLPTADGLAEGADRRSPGVEPVEARAAVRLPAGGRARAPLAVSLQRPFGALVSTYGVDAGVLRVTRSVRMDVKAAVAAGRTAYESFRKAVDTDHEQSFFVAPLDAASATAESLHEAGKAAFAEKAYDRAVDLLLDAADRDPKRPDVWNDLGRALRDAGDPAAALEAFDAEIEANPFDEYAYAERAYVLIEKLGRHDEAEADLLKQIEVAPFRAWSYARMGERRVAQKRFAEAAKYYEQAATTEPKTKSHWVDLGWAQAEAGEHGRAHATFAHARTLDLEDWRQVRVARGLSYLGDQALAGELAAEALPSLAARAAKLDARSVKLGDAYWTDQLAEAWYLVGSAALAKGDTAGAERHLGASWKAQVLPGTARALSALRKAQQRPNEAADWQAVAAAFVEGADLASGNDLLLKERTVALVPPVREDFEEDVLLLVDATGRLSSARRLSARNAAKADRYLARIGTPRLGFPALPGGAEVKLVRTGLLVCATATGCSLILDMPDTRPEEDTSQVGRASPPGRTR